MMGSPQWSRRPARELVMSTLFTVLKASVQVAFTATTTEGSDVLTAVSSTAGLFCGLPVVGGSIPRGSVITSLSPLTLSQPAAAAGTAVPLLTGFLTTGRRVIPWNKVSSQPALFLRGADEDLEYPGTLLQSQTIDAEIWIYTNAGQNPNAVPETALNNLMDAIQAAFVPDVPGTGRFTLGQLVQWCRLEGRVIKDPGDTSGQAIALMPVKITVP
jgi:hypothetical protein